MTVDLGLTLEGRHVTLVPLAVEHVDALVAAASEDRATYAFGYVPATLEQMRRYVGHALERRERGITLPFSTVDAASGRIVGTTRFHDIQRYEWPGGSPHTRPVDSVEIGWTWLAHSAQRTAINTEAKYLMLRHAFDTWRCHRVMLKTDERNGRSRRAIERIGGQFEGIWRAVTAGADGALRSSAYYSITEPEWPDVREALEAKLQRSL